MSYKFFQNHSCEYYPCHMIEPSKFNCFGCYCPLYTFNSCGGNFKMINGDIKDCSDCIIPHTNPDYVIDKLKELIFNKGDKI